MRVLDYALATDGGTQIVTLELADGKQAMIGLDGRMDSPVSGEQLFIGGSPESPTAQLLPIGGGEEAEAISWLETWLVQTQGSGRQESLMEADYSTLAGQDLLDRLAIEFLLEIRDRGVGP